ncbi:MAG: exo-alpha-sialidase [Gemmatimonadota bacterium]|nr:exo-alpha-sialidase [Gemmatimonadota bacterium]
MIFFSAARALFIFTALVCLFPARARAGEKLFFQESYIVKGSALIPECYSPSLVRLPDGTLACAWAAGSGRMALDTSIKLSFSRAGEDPWTEPVTVADDDGYADNYPVLTLLPGDRLRLFYATYYREKRKVPPGANWAAWHLKYCDSGDLGRIWGGDFFLIPESGRIPCGSTADLANGHILLPVTDFRHKVPSFLISEDKGGYWKDAARIPEAEGLADPAVVELEPGRILAMLRPDEKSDREKVLQSTESTDNGLTWSRPQPTEFKNPSGPVALLSLGRGRLVMAWNDHELWLTPMTLALSRDNGKTWPYRRNLETGKWDIREPSLAVTEDGHIHLVYVSRNIYLKHIEVNEAWIMGNK